MDHPYSRPTGSSTDPARPVDPLAGYTMTAGQIAESKAKLEAVSSAPVRVDRHGFPVVEHAGFDEFGMPIAPIGSRLERMVSIAPVVQESPNIHPVQPVSPAPSDVWPPPPTTDAPIAGPAINLYVPTMYKSGAGLAWAITLLITVQICLHAMLLRSWELVNVTAVQLAILDQVLLIISGTVFLFWMHRIYRNLVALDTPGLAATPAKAVWCFIVPFVSLYWPRTIVHEMWRASNPERFRTVDPMAWLRGPTTPLIDAWWISYVARSLLFSYARMNGAPSLYAFGHVATMISGVLAIIVVQSLTSRQDDRAGGAIDRYTA